MLAFYDYNEFFLHYLIFSTKRKHAQTHIPTCITVTQNLGYTKPSGTERWHNQGSACIMKSSIQVHISPSLFIAVNENIKQNST
jgi:hypothetical protein